MKKMKLAPSEYERFMALSKRVGEWSAANFAGKSKFSEFRYVEPLLGIQEELGELEESLRDEDAEDAIADVVIYLADFVYQTGIILSYPEGRLPGSTLGRMFRAVLKNSQRIRGYQDEQYYKSELEYWCSLFLYEFCQYKNVDVLYLAEKEFTNTVSKRDWVANPGTGV